MDKSVTKKFKLKCALSGGIAGFINGFFGGGGGMLLVPMLAGLDELEERETFATSLSVTLPLSIISASIYMWRQDITITSLLPFLIGGIPGAVIAGLTFKKIPTKLLRRLMGILIILGGIKYLI